MVPRTVDERSAISVDRKPYLYLCGGDTGILRIAPVKLAPHAPHRSCHDCALCKLLPGSFRDNPDGLDAENAREGYAR